MSPEAQRIAIAEACGWKWSAPFNHRKTYNDLTSPHGNGLCRLWKDGKIGGHGLPDYLADLNAMHSAEKVLTAQQVIKYDAFLGAFIWTTGIPASLKNWHSTAAQRVEAFLRTLGKWEEST